MFFNEPGGLVGGRTENERPDEHRDEGSEHNILMEYTMSLANVVIWVLLGESSRENRVKGKMPRTWPRMTTLT
jgi:hypothetical protein